MFEKTCRQSKIRKDYDIPNLCLAGGVALNCVANGKLAEEGIFDQIWVQPAAGDAGGSVGAALAFDHLVSGTSRPSKTTDGMNGCLLGSAYSNDEIRAFLNEISANYQELDSEEIYDHVAGKIAQGKAIGWFQGKMEFGPRALGSRSIIADPRARDMQRKLNLKIKFRESFRPFAPAVLEENAEQYFNVYQKNEYMLFVSQIAENIKIEEEDSNLVGLDKLNIARSTLPSITHVDSSARVQVVTETSNPFFYKLLQSFNHKTGCPVLINTSFNVRGEPIVESPLDAYKCFMGTDLDVLCIGNFVLDKENQDKNLLLSYHREFEAD